MFITDVPYIPAQETPIVLAQTNTSGATPQPDYILKDCQETMSTGLPTDAIRGIEPGYALANALNQVAGKIVVSDPVNIKNIILLESTKHGKLEQHTAPNGELYYMYQAKPEYVGDDRAVFMAEFEGKRYKIVVNLKVSLVVDNNSPLCPENPYELIKVTKPSSGDSGYGTSTEWLRFSSAISPTCRSSGTPQKRGAP